MAEAWNFIIGDPGAKIVIIADHASATVPEDLDLGIDPGLLGTHIAVDLGVADLTAALCARLGCPAILGGVSRLVIDLNREEDAAGLVPIESDGVTISGNIGADASARIARFWQPYHSEVARIITAQQARLLISLHSFTPQLATQPEEARPWEVGILYNQDYQAARVALPMLEAAGVIVGDQLPYSGKDLNATMNAHGEANGIAYLGIEMRQDLIGDTEGVARWADMLLPVILTCAGTEYR
jgi:predicted N-formylglutamate amidohydrolase